ncbi:MAG: hypothetical protein ACK4XK_11590 [Casimicrobiaceae bacterium]
MRLQICAAHFGIQTALRPGLKALGVHSRRIKVASPWKAECSIDLDQALHAQHPNEPRWDYGVELTFGQHRAIDWVEVHPAYSSEVGTVLAKLAWLKRLLATGEANGACSAGSFHWLATDAGVHIDSAPRRRLNAAGLRMPQSMLQLG